MAGRSLLWGLRLVVFGMVAGCSASSVDPPVAGSASPAAFPSTAAAAIYTTEQADRGQQLFNRNCSTCHARNQFSGQMFEITWMADPIGGLYQFIRTAMPQNDPGSLAPEEYAAIVAYFLRLNGRPAGDIALPADGELLEEVRW